MITRNLALFCSGDITNGILLSIFFLHTNRITIVMIIKKVSWGLAEKLHTPENLISLKLRAPTNPMPCLIAAGHKKVNEPT